MATPENDLRKKALMDQMGGDPEQPDPIGGTSLAPDTGLPGATAQDPTNAAAGYDVAKWNGLPSDEQAKYEAGGGAPTMAAAAPARDFSRLRGYDEGKFNANKNDAKYQIGGALSTFDPRQGVTDDVLKALNGLGYGNFSGKGQHLSLGGLTDAGKQAGLTDNYNNADFIQGFSGGDGKWAYQDPAYEAQHPELSQPQGGGGGTMPNFGGAQLDSALGGDPLAKIQQLIAQLSAGGNRPNFDALMAQLGGQ